MSADRQRSYRRVGDTAQCPACGVSIAPEAYRCPRCLIYFCYKCRRRVAPRDPQYQCMNQQCEQYGKLLCNACIVEIPVMGSRDHQELVEPARQELVGAAKPGYWAPALSRREVALVSVCMAIVGSAIASLTLTWHFGIPIGIVVGVAVSMCLANVGEQIPPVAATYQGVPPVYKTVTEAVEVGRSKCCVACRQAVQHL